ncbi:MAG: sulfite exporter TauE/SafE family protein, partial [Burkholderiales bacterium]
MVLDAITVAVSLATVFVTTFTKGAFGGGFAILGIPLLALVMDPLSAGALLAPMFCLSDLFAFRYWKATSWSKPDLMLLIPAQVA